MAGNCKQGITTTAMPTAGPEPDPGNETDPEDEERRRRIIRERRERDELFTIQARGFGRRLRAKGDTDGPEDITGAADRDIVGDFLRKASGPAVIDRVVEGAKDAHQAVKDYYEETADKQWAIAACVFDTQKAVARILYAITFMGFAAIDCREELFQKQGEVAKDKCVIDIGLIVASLAIAANMIAISQINCPHQLAYLPDNLCAAGILNVISSSAYVAVAFAGIHDSCKEVDPDGI